MQFLCIQSIVWDTDGEAVDLPDSYMLPVSDLLDDDESMDDFTDDADKVVLYDRAVDKLSDIFGWCVFACKVEEVN